MISLVHRRGPWLHVLTVLVLCAAGWVLAQQKIEDRTPFADEVQYLVMAHNAFHRGTISLTPPDVAPPEPSAYREPGYPVFLAALMVFDAGFASLGAKCVTHKTKECEGVFMVARQANTLLMVASALLVWGAVWRLVRQPIVAHVALFLLIGNVELHEFNTFLISDPLALFMSAFLSLMLVVGYDTGRPLAAAAAGLVLGLLVLTKGAFMLLALPIGAALLLRLWRNKAEARQHWLCFAVFVLVHGAVVGAWIARNEIALGHAVLIQRGGHVLAHRVELNTMTAQEYGTAFVWWTRGFGDNLARRWLPEEAYRRFELHRADGFYNAAQAKWEALLQEERAGGADDRVAERRATGRMIGEILEHAPKNILTTLPIAYRGLSVDAFAILTVPALIVLSIAAARRVPAFYWFALPGLYNFGVHALVTLNLPRFNIPTLPTLAAAGSIVIWWIIARRRVRTRRILHESEGARGNAG